MKITLTSKMKLNIFKLSTLLILLSVLLLACSRQALLNSKVTETLAPVPTSTPTTISESFSSYTSPEFRLSLKYPRNWLVIDDPETLDLPSADTFEFTSVTLASDLGLKRSDAASFKNGQGFIVVFFYDGKGINFPPDRLPDVLQNSTTFLPPDKESPKMVTLNGKQFAIAAYDIAKHGVPYPNFVAAASFGDKLVYSLVYTSIANEEEFRVLFEEILSTIEYSGK